MKKINLLLALAILSSLLYAEKMDLILKCCKLPFVNISIESEKVDDFYSINVGSKTTKFCSIVTKFDNSYFIEADKNFLTKSLEKKIIQEEYQEDRIISFDRKNLKGKRSSRISDSLNVEFPIDSETRDFFSTLYFLRFNEMGGKHLIVHANSIDWKMNVSNLGEEEIDTVFGDTSAIKYKLKFEKISKKERTNSDILTNNIISPERTVYFWFSNDERRIPLKAYIVQKSFNVTWILKKYQS